MKYELMWRPKDPAAISLDCRKNKNLHKVSCASLRDKQESAQQRTEVNSLVRGCKKVVNITVVHGMLGGKMHSS